jgi:hypothetical protein
MQQKKKKKQLDFEPVSQHINIHPYTYLLIADALFVKRTIWNKTWAEKSPRKYSSYHKRSSSTSSCMDAGVYANCV